VSRERNSVLVNISPLDISTLKRVKMAHAEESNDPDNIDSERSRRYVLAANRLMSYAVRLKLDHPHIRGVPVLPLPEIRVPKLEADILGQARALEENSY
jgi:hypothetical protein